MTTAIQFQEPRARKPRTRINTVRDKRERVKYRATGFTLLELLIVIAIIAILSAILIFVLNPAETLLKGRDSNMFGGSTSKHGT